MGDLAPGPPQSPSPLAPLSLLFKLTVELFSHFQLLHVFLLSKMHRHVLHLPHTQISYLRDLSIIELHQMLSQFDSLLDFYFINFH